MRIKKLYLVIVIIIFIIGIGVYESYSNYQEYKSSKSKIDLTTNNDISLSDDQEKIIRTLVGLESKEIRILDKPLRVDGKFEIPENTMLRIIKYYLNSTNNKKISDIDLKMEKEKIVVEARYKILNTFKTPIEISVIPTLTKSSNIKLKITNVAVVGFSMEENLIDKVIKSWFSNIDNIMVKNGEIIIDKSNLRKVTIKSISLEKKDLLIDLSIKL